MTGVGKTSVGEILAEKLNYNFLDLDLIIAEKTGKIPAEIFALYGEEYFRKIEAAELENVFEKYKDGGKNLILSCGGGIVLSKNNRELLKTHSFVIWLVRPADEIKKNKEILSRPPINNDIKNYIKIFDRRENLYAETCAINGLKIECGNISDAVESITESLIINFMNYTE